ncbi:hypothetical protein [Tenacibaculum finnmarkense]|uniref:hypothetical protein n=1 Tax=Tenacibaculum finnmarkense TaxID=2781243 RepID=UPI001EFAAAF8|nr:hypothetical protein [Tenacibaculum finnmarkense]MCG8226400.1 hypothetical protein [Tenacibaculum finnmarkense genomovar finnmarkense]
MILSALLLENYLSEIKIIALRLKSENKKITRGLVRGELQKKYSKLTKNEANLLINEFIK